MSLGPSAWADGKTVSSLGDPGRLVTSVFLVFSNTGAAHPLPQKLPSLQWSSVCFWVPLVSPRRMLLMNQGSQDPWGLAQGLLGTHSFPCGTQEHFTVVRFFFFIFGATSAPAPIFRMLPSPQVPSACCGVPQVGQRRTLGLNWEMHGSQALPQALTGRHVLRG